MALDMRAGASAEVTAFQEPHGQLGVGGLAKMPYTMPPARPAPAGAAGMGRT